MARSVRAKGPGGGQVGIGVGPRPIFVI